MPKTRKSHPPSLKAKVAVEAIKAHETATQIAQMFSVHPTQAGGWKKQALDGLRLTSLWGSVIVLKCRTFNGLSAMGLPGAGDRGMKFPSTSSNE